MRLLRLTLHNIASIEKAAIDFERGPLANDSLFLICGPTGAGKSTLLDAICLALYNTTPRLANAARESYIDQRDSFSGSGTGIGVDDPRMLMRRGATAASVELLFTDKDDQPLKALWSCSRARGKAGGKIQNVAWTLSEADDTVLSARKSEIQRLIQERVGLTFEQFCRTTLLAQGDFTKFLKAPEREKAEILEKLTGTEVYSLISQEIHNITTERRARLDLLEERSKGIRLLGDEQLAEIEVERKGLEERRAAIVAEERAATAAHQWLVARSKAEETLAGAERSLDEQRTRLGRDDFQIGERLLMDWSRSEAARAHWREERTLAKEVARHAETEAGLRDQYARLCGGQLHLAAAIEKGEALEAVNRSFLAKESAHEELYAKVALIESLLRQAATARQAIRQTEDALAKAREDRQHLANELALCGKRLEEAVAAEREQGRFLDEAQARLRALDLDGLTRRDRQLAAFADNLRSLLELMRLLRQHTADLAVAETARSARADELRALSEAHPRLQAAAHALAVRVTEQEAIYERQKKACDDFALLHEIREGLREGDRCPLCGAPVGHLPSEHTFTSLLAPLQESLTRLRTESREAERQVSESEARQKVLRGALREQTAERDRRARLREEVETRRAAHLLAADYADEPSVERALSENAAERARVAEALGAIDGEQRKLIALQRERDRATLLVREAERRRTAAAERLALCDSRLSAGASTIAAHQATLSQNEQALSRYVDPADYERPVAPGLPSPLDQLKERAARYAREQSLAPKIEQRLATLRQEREQVEASRSAVSACHPDWDAIEVVPEEIAGLPGEWTRLLAAVRSNADAKRSALVRQAEARRELDDYLARPGAIDAGRLAVLMEHSTEEIEALRLRHQGERDRLTRLEAEREAAAGALARLVGERPPMDADATVEGLMLLIDRLRVEAKEKDEALGRLRERLRSDEESRRLLADTARETEVARRDYEAWARLHALFGSSDGKRFRNIAQSYVLRQLLLGANHYLGQLTGRYELVCQPGSLTILLRDHDAGDVTRPTTTLSGGECFLVSLSLALGLSSLSRAGMGMDILFIDEGFGTLDGTYLSTVMDTLERLHQMGGKRVGIISHVESLKERLTTQIQVLPESGTLSRVSVVGS